MELESEPYPKRRLDALTGVMMLITLAALAGAGWLGIGRPSSIENAVAAVGAQAPPLRLIDPETSEPIVLVGLTNKVCWIVFWSASSTTGRSCLAELETASRRLRMHPMFAMAAAAADLGDPGAVHEAARATGFQAPVYLADAETRRRFGAEEADPPLHILIDAGGKVLAMARGDGAGVIGRIAGVASRRLEEIDPRGTMRFAATTGRQC